MNRKYSKLNCGCYVNCDNGGGLLGKCSTTNCQFGIWITKHQLCDTCNKCLNCDNHDGHSKLNDLDDYIKSILGM